MVSTVSCLIIFRDIIIMFLKLNFIIIIAGHHPYYCCSRLGHGIDCDHYHEKMVY